jgi:hypothetical protein
MLVELIALQRESNALTRELIALLSGRSALTPSTPANVHPLVTAVRSSTMQQADPAKRKIYTEQDVSYHTREDDLRLQELQREGQDPRKPRYRDQSRPVASPPAPASPTSDLVLRSLPIEHSEHDPADEGDELLHP